MYRLLDENTDRLMMLLDFNYSTAVMYAHKKCYQDFRTYLEQTQTAYSFETGLLWLDNHKDIWKHSKYKSNRLAIYQLNDMFNTGTISTYYVYENSPSYKRLPDWCRGALNRYLEGELLSFGKGYVNIKRIACSHFLDFLCTEGIQDCREITLPDIIAYHRQGNHISQKCRERYEAIVRSYLEYLHRWTGLPLSLSISLDKFTIPYVEFWDALSSVVQKHIIQVSAASNRVTLSTDDFLKTSDDFVNVVLPMHKYSYAMIKSFRKVYRLMFIFLEMSHFPYSPELAEVWFGINKSTFRTQWKSYRRALFLFEQYLKNGDILPELMIPYHQDPVRKFPAWVRKPLEDYVALRKKENRADSTLAMIRSSCMRFLSFLLAQHISSFNAITPELVSRFNREDKHRTADGKNAYNVRIRMFLEYLSEVGLVADSLYLAIPCVSAPKTRIISILDDSEIDEIQNYSAPSGEPMRLRKKAIVLLGLRMGLRSSDIVNLDLSDIFWKNCSLSIVQKKTGIGLTLPMPVNVANTIYRYILHGRPDSNSSFVFIHHRVPYKQLNRTACSRALHTVLGSPDKSSGIGFHITRKTFASKLLKAGNPVHLIVDSLGHQTDSTVSKYLALDDKNLRLCAVSLALAGISLEGGVCP